ncbi:MAG: chromosome segregation ATPase [Candidatus Azotimanducaceae bacterium]
MHLKHLTITGFKSFAKKSELEFSAPITSIVGPNGSGKSNVAEAFRFVLGEQSVKSMRGKKGEDLIWGGSDSVSRGNRAAVSVTLANEKRVFPVDFDEIVLERVVHRDGQNEYSVNGSKVRLKDVQELLAAANIGSTGHHIISQGEADRILSAGPRERREMIEDALGLKVYQYKKQEAEKKLKKTKENVEKVESLRREVAPHLKFLERQMKKIEKSIELQNSLKTFYKEYLRREDLYIAHHFDRLTILRHEPASKIESLKELLIQAKQTLAEAEKDEKRDELISVESKVSEVRELRQNLLRKSGQLEGQIEFLIRRIKSEQEKAAQKTDVLIPYSEVEEIVQKIETQTDKAAQSDAVDLLQRALSGVVHTLRKFLSNAQETETVGTQDEEKELEVLEKEKKAVEEELQSVTQNETKLQEEYNSVKVAIESDASQSREAEREVFRVVGEQREAELSLSKIDSELEVLERERNEFKRELQEAVSLLGRDASAYFSYQIVVDGAEVTADALLKEDRETQRQRRRELEKMKIRLEELGDGENSDVAKEYKDVSERDQFLVKEITDLNESVLKLDILIKDLSGQLNEQFVIGIEKIGAEFSRFFTLMFGGGTAELLRVKPKVLKKKSDEDDMPEDGEDEDEEDPEAQEGIELDVKLPNKRVKGLEMLSGGERALTSIALIFAMSQVNPPLFVILDETDAALDEANSRRYGDMIQALAEKSQLILITHNRETMGRAGILYGVTMSGDGVSKLLSVKFDEAVAVAK